MGEVAQVSKFNSGRASGACRGAIGFFLLIEGLVSQDLAKPCFLTPLDPDEIIFKSSQLLSRRSEGQEEPVTCE
jgi:hypothetical protein